MELRQLVCSVVCFLAAACLAAPPADPAPGAPRVGSPASWTAAAPAQTAQSSEPAGSQAGDLAKQLANPVASLISVPFQLNYDEDIGPGDDGERWVLNVQPVVPIGLNEDWNLISRTILPLVSQDDVPPGDDESGLGDVLQSFFFSPVEPTEGGWIWGVGPALLLPTASDDTLGQEQWGLGPTGVVLKQSGPWTYGALANHLWKVAGDDDRRDVNATFLQPFLAYSTPEGWTATVNSESTYDWAADELVVPVNVLGTKVVTVGGQLVSVGGGLRYWIEDSDSSPEGLGLRFIVTLLYPKKKR